MVPQFLRPHHVLRPRDRCRTITPLLLNRVLPEPVHAALSETKMSTITHLARVPGKELPQEVPLKPIPVCPSPAVGDLHDAHSHPGFTRRQHSAHVENPPVPCEAFVPQQIVHALRRSHHTKIAGIAMLGQVRSCSRCCPDCWCWWPASGTAPLLSVAPHRARNRANFSASRHCSPAAGSWTPGNNPR